MSKENRLRDVASIFLTTLLLMALSTVGVPAVTAQQAQKATVNTKSAAVVAATEEVLRETSEVRKLPIMRPVKSGAQSRDEIERMIITNLNEDTTPEEMRASELAFKKLGLAPNDFQYRDFIVKLLAEQVAGYYDPKTQEFYLADWINLDGQRPVMAHELTHALQDQHFNLRRFQKWPKGDSDAELAAHALVEGDATLAMTHYIMRNPLRALAMMKSMNEGTSSTELIDRAPRALRESLLFPYDSGMKWAAEVYKRGGWELLSRAYKDLPQSTEQIMHVEKYFSRESPIKIDMPDVAALLGAGWKRTDYDVNGEWSFYLILDEYLKAEVRSRQAASGWGGDRYALYEGPRAGDVMLAQHTAWDTEMDAREFFEAYAERTGLRYKATKSAVAVPEGVKAEAFIWQTPEGAVLMQRRGTRVVILEGVPEKADMNKLLRALWP